MDWRVVLVFGSVIIMFGAIAMAYYAIATSTTPFSTATQASSFIKQKPAANRGSSIATGLVTLTVT